MSKPSFTMEVEEVNQVSDDEESSQASSSTRHYTLYFIRHAEALHNQLEKQAMSEALSLAVSQGHAPDSPHAKQAKEEARRGILENEGMADPPLSEAGFEEARNAKAALDRLMQTYDLPRVEEVWVSPLQRTLQTAATIFPESASSPTSSSSSTNDGPAIRVKKELEERRTGLLCDTHSPVEQIRSRRTFLRFSLSGLSLEKTLKATNEGRAGGIESIQEGAIWEDKSEAVAVFQGDDADTPVEEKDMLRERTKKLFEMLAESNSRSICLIGHKGYLRELERGPLGQADARLFTNCEVRVYRLHLDVGAQGVSGDDVVIEPVPVLQRADKIASSGN